MGLGNCKTEAAHASVHQLLWLFELMKILSPHYKQYRKLVSMHLFSRTQATRWWVQKAQIMNWLD